MAEYIERAAAIAALGEHPLNWDDKPDEVQAVCDYDLHRSAILSVRAADVAPVVHGTPMLRYRPERYERYEEQGLNENGEMLYLKRILVDEKSYAMYCPCCGKRLCSRFKSFCPNCGAKMDGGDNDA